MGTAREGNAGIGVAHLGGISQEKGRAGARREGAWEGEYAGNTP